MVIESSMYNLKRSRIAVTFPLFLLEKIVAAPDGPYYELVVELAQQWTPGIYSQRLPDGALLTYVLSDNDWQGTGIDTADDLAALVTGGDALKKHARYGPLLTGYAPQMERWREYADVPRQQLDRFAGEIRDVLAAAVPMPPLKSRQHFSNCRGDLLARIDDLADDELFNL